MNVATLGAGEAQHGRQQRQGDQQRDRDGGRGGQAHDNPAGAERLAFGVLFFIPECLPDLAYLSDAELREALQTTILRMLRVLSRSPRPVGNAVMP